MWSLKKSLAARYKGAYTRKLKRMLIPGYGTRAAGWLHPKRKLYNKVYYRTSIDTRKVIGSLFTGARKTNPKQRAATEEITPEQLSGALDAVMIFISAVLLAGGHFFWAVLLVVLIGLHVVKGEHQGETK